jgi:hypothetical protein
MTYGIDTSPTSFGVESEKLKVESEPAVASNNTSNNTNAGSNADNNNANGNSNDNNPIG